MIRKAAVLLLLVLVAGAAFLVWRGGWLDAWLAVPVGEVTRQSERYPEGATVRVRGKVTRSMNIPFTDADYYKLEDATGAIWVRTRTGLPPQGVEGTVRGTVRRKQTDLPFVEVRSVLLDEQSFRARR